MKILLVGGAGEVGRYLLTYFAQRGHDIRILDKAPKAHGLGEGLQFEYVQGDITDRELVNKSLQGMEVVIHLAWSFADDAQTIFGDDIQGHIHLLDAASERRIQQFVYTSTAVVYGRATAHPVTEDHPCLIREARKPLYGLGKYTAEELCRVYSKDRGVPSTIFRFWWAFGDTIGGRHLRDLVRKALNHEPLEMVRGAGGTFVTMSDLGRIMKASLGRPASGQVYNVGSLFVTWEEIGQMIIRLANSKSSIRLIPSEDWKGPAFLNEVWDLSWQKAERELGYHPQASSEEMRSQLSKSLQTCVHQVREGAK